MKHSRTLLIFIIVIAILGCSTSKNLFQVTVKEIKGQVECLFENQKEFKQITQETKLKANESARTQLQSSCSIVFPDHSVIFLDEKTYFKVTEGESFGKQETGTAIYDIKPQATPRTITTPQGVTTILGTVFLQEIFDNKLNILVKEGKVSFTSNANNDSRIISSGEKLIIESGKPLPSPSKMTFRDLDKFDIEKKVKLFK